MESSFKILQKGRAKYVRLPRRRLAYDLEQNSTMTPSGASHAAMIAAFECDPRDDLAMSMARLGRGVGARNG